MRTSGLWRRFRILRWLVLCVGFGAFAVNCGIARAPRLWKCQCRVVCLDAASKSAARTVNQLSCGYDRPGALRDGDRRCQLDAAKLSGCKRAKCVCDTCQVSRHRYCARTRSRRSPSPGFGGWFLCDVPAGGFTSPHDFVSPTDPDADDYYGDQHAPSRSHDPPAKDDPPGPDDPETPDYYDPHGPDPDDPGDPMDPDAPGWSNDPDDPGGYDDPGDYDDPDDPGSSDDPDDW